MTAALLLALVLASPAEPASAAPSSVEPTRPAQTAEAPSPTTPSEAASPAPDQAQPAQQQPAPQQPATQQPAVQPPASPQQRGVPAYQPAPPVAPAPHYPPPPRRVWRGKGLMIAGWSIFGATYLISTLVGTTAIDQARCDRGGGFDEGDLGCTTDESRRRYGRRMLVPVVGPFMAVATEYGDPEAVFLGINQVAGLVMGIVGTIRYVSTGRRGLATLRLRDGRALALDLGPTTAGGFARAALSF